MTYEAIMKKIKEADEVMFELNEHEKDYNTARALFKALGKTSRYMTLYLNKKELDGVELAVAELELNEYMVTK